MNSRKLVIQTVAVTLLIVTLYLLGSLFMKFTPVALAGAPAAIGAGQVLWIERNFDVLLQGFILFAGALGVLVLIGDPARPRGTGGRS